MATESDGETTSPPRLRPTSSWLPLVSIMAAILCIVIFGFALANVTMRLQRHITAKALWAADRHKMAAAYADLSSAAASNDSLAYGLVLRFAEDDIRSLEAESWAMPKAGNTGRLAFVKQVQQCLPVNVAAFHAETPAALATCKVLLAQP